jgi:hypothetical protein
MSNINKRRLIDWVIWFLVLVDKNHFEYWNESIIINDRFFFYILPLLSLNSTCPQQPTENLHTLD